MTEDMLLVLQVERQSDADIVDIRRVPFATSMRRSSSVGVNRKENAVRIML